MATYLVLVHGKSGAYGASVPDFPGCTSGGRTIDEVLARIRLAAAEWMEAVAGKGEPIPPARTIDSLRADPELADDFEGAVFIATIELEAVWWGQEPDKCTWG